MAENISGFIEKLYRQTYATLFKVAYRATHSNETTQDLIHETFLLAIFNEKKLAKHPKPEAWLMITLRNLILHEQRSKSRQDVPLEEVAEILEKTMEPSFSEFLPAQLNDREKEILIWRFEQQLSYQEISQRLGCSVDLCRKRVSQAVRKCRELLS